MVGHGEWVTISTVPSAKLAFVIHAPKFIGGLGLAAPSTSRVHPTTTLPGRHQARIHKNGPYRARRRPANVRLQSLQSLLELLGTPRRVLKPKIDDLFHFRRRSPVWTPTGTTRAVYQRFLAKQLVAIHQRMPCLARNTELTTEVANSLAVQISADKHHAFCHSGALVPRHCRSFGAKA